MLRSGKYLRDRYPSGDFMNPGVLRRLPLKQALPRARARPQDTAVGGLAHALQRRQPSLVLIFVDLTPREPFREHLLGRNRLGWRARRLLAAMAEVPNKRDDADNHRAPEQHHADGHDRIPPAAHAAAVPIHHRVLLPSRPATCQAVRETESTVH